MNVAGRKNAALFEWAAFVKAEKEELALRVIESVCRVLASMPHCGWFLPNAIFDYVHPYVHGFFGCFGQKPLSTSSGSRCVTMFRLVVLRARIAREIAVPNSDVRKNLRSHMKQPCATGN